MTDERSSCLDNAKIRTGQLITIETQYVKIISDVSVKRGPPLIPGALSYLPDLQNILNRWPSVFRRAGSYQ